MTFIAAGSQDINLLRAIDHCGTLKQTVSPRSSRKFVVEETCRTIVLSATKKLASSILCFLMHTVNASRVAHNCYRVARQMQWEIHNQLLKE